MVIGSLAVNLGLNSSTFNTGVANATNRIKTFSRDVDNSTSVMTKLQSGLKTTATVAAAAGAAVAGAAVVGFRMLRTEMESIDEIGKMAGKLGIDTETFVGLQHGANLSGIELNNLETSLLKMTRNLSTAATSGGPVADVLRELRLEAKSLAAMRPDAALYVLADAIETVESPMDRVRIATQLFGRTGADMLLMMAGGSDTLRSMQRDAEKLGLTFSEMDFKQVEIANDAMTRLGLSTGVLTRTLAIDLAPTLTVIADSLTDLFSTGGRQAAGFSSELGGIAAAAGVVLDVVQQIAIHWTATQAVLLRGAAEVADVLAMIPDTVKIPGTAFGFLPAQEDLKTAAAGLHGAFVDFNKRVNELEKADWAASFADRIKTMRDEIQAGLDAGKPTTGLADLDALNEQLKAMDALRARGEQLAAALRTPQEALEARIQDANKMLDLGAIGWQTYTREIQAAQKAFLDATNTFSGGPALIEKGTQAAFAAEDRWREMQERMRQPLPGAGLVRQRQPGEAAVFGGVGPQVDPFVPQLPEIPRPEIHRVQQLPQNMDLGIPRLGREAELPEQIRQSVVFDVAPLPDIDIAPIEVPVTFDVQRVDLSAIPQLGRPRPEISPLPSTMNVTRVEPVPVGQAGESRTSRIDREEGSLLRDIPRLGRENAAVEKELQQLNRQTSQMLKRLDTIAAESRLTTNNTKDTATGVRQIQVPEVVEM
ncbi:MAG: hypothetical protein GXX96_35310 [Planctomycetaceae bacterium]|nr:hypothetical protein [Planctomycetaceae bacterium]